MCEQLYLTDDRLLFDKIRGGNAKAFEYAFRKFSPRLEAFAQKYTNDTNEAEDIVQDVFLKLWERRELLDNISLTSFLFMMVRNSCLNYLKHRQIADTVQQRIPDTGYRDCRAIICGGFRTRPFLLADAKGTVRLDRSDYGGTTAQMQGSVRSQPSERLEKPGDSGTYGYYGESGGETHYPCLETIPGWIKALCLITGNAP